jgi:hypothetical protein
MGKHLLHKSGTRVLDPRLPRSFPNPQGAEELELVGGDAGPVLVRSYRGLDRSRWHQT